MMTVAQLRTQIARITGRMPVSRDLKYLTTRLASLRREKGANIEDTAGSVIMTISMPATARAALKRVSELENENISTLIRVAVAAYARGRGYAAEADQISRRDEETCAHCGAWLGAMSTTHARGCPESES